VHLFPVTKSKGKKHEKRKQPQEKSSTSGKKLN
jgi:hypothetical protein